MSEIVVDVGDGWVFEVLALAQCSLLAVWVWPESLWAPISFTKAYLKRNGESEDKWKDYWCDPEAGVFQFIGQDNIYFYGVAQMPLWMAQQGKEYVGKCALAFTAPAP